MLARYRKTKKEILNAAREMADAGVHLIDLTMGEDPELYSSGESGFKRFIGMIKSVQEETKLPVMISPGILPESPCRTGRGTGYLVCLLPGDTQSSPL